MNIEEHAEFINAAFHHASTTLPSFEVSPKRPWISQKTLDLISKRGVARREGNYTVEKQVNREVRASAKADRKAFLEAELAGGSWKSIQRLRKGPGKKYTGIKNPEGTLVDLSERAETLAEYFEKVQWEICFANLLPTDSAPINDCSNFPEYDFSEADLSRVLQKLKIGA